MSLQMNNTVYRKKHFDTKCGYLQDCLVVNDIFYSITYYISVMVAYIDYSIT